MKLLQSYFRDTGFNKRYSLTQIPLLYSITVSIELDIKLWIGWKKVRFSFKKAGLKNDR